MPLKCETCGRQFSRNANLLRHILAVHVEKKRDVEDAEESDPEEIGEEAVADDEMPDASSEQSDEEEEAVEASDEEEEDEPDEDHDYWREIVATAAGNVDYDDPEELLKEPKLSEMVDEMRQIVEARMAFAEYMMNDDAVFHKITKAKTRNDDGDSDDEAEETGWNDKRFLLKRVVEKHIDVLNDESDIQDSDVEDEVDEDMGHSLGDQKIEAQAEQTERLQSLIQKNRNGINDSEGSDSDDDDA